MSGRRRRQPSKKPFYTGLALAALVGAGVLAWVATSRKEADPVTVDPNLQPGTAQGYLLGDPNAPVQVLEFADFECPACGNYAVVTGPDVKKRLVDAGKMSIRFYDFPLAMHRNTWPAHRAAACANDQGKFWEMHDRIFAGQTEWNGQATRSPEDVFERYARELGLNADTFDECLDSRKHDATIRANVAEGERLRVGSTPTFVIGGRLYPGSLPFDEMAKIVDSVTKAGTGRVGTPAASPASPASPGQPLGDTAASKTVPATGQ